MRTVNFEDGEYSVSNLYGLAWRWERNGKTFNSDEFLFIREMGNPTPRFKIRWRRLVDDDDKSKWDIVRDRIAKYRSGLK